MPPFVLTGKTIVVTGANRGIGLEFARQLVGRPGNLIIAGVRRPDNAAALKELGSAIQVFPLDVTDPSSIESFADEVKKATPHVDVLINNAGVIGQALSLDLVTKEAMVDVFVANTVGPLLTVRALHQRALLGGEAGSLVATVTSKMGSIADCSSGYYDYRASKAAVNVVNKALAGDLGRDNVTLTLLHPGYVKTDMTGGKGNIDATTSVHGMLTVLESGSDLQGTWHAWDGQQGAYFKVEQEADLQRYRERLVKEGVLDKSTPKPDPRSVEESLHAFEVQPEILQQQARLDDPDAAKRREFLRRGKAVFAEMTPEERHRYRLASSPIGRSLGHIPKVTMGRGRWDVTPPAHVAPATVRALSPEAVEVARRTYAVGLRAIAYGTLLGLGAVALAGSYAAQSLGVGQPGADAAGSLREWLRPFAEGVRDRLAPAKEALGGLLGGSSNAENAERSEFQHRLMKRFNPAAAGAPEGGRDQSPFL